MDPFATAIVAALAAGVIDGVKSPRRRWPAQTMGRVTDRLV